MEPAPIQNEAPTEEPVETEAPAPTEPPATEVLPTEATEFVCAKLLTLEDGIQVPAVDKLIFSCPPKYVRNEN